MLLKIGTDILKVSAIIPVYNGEGTVQRAVHSALNQAIPDSEVLVINDGSTDSTREALSAFGDRIRIIDQENKGLSAARNAGVRAARGTFVAFLDADDEWLPGKLKHQLEILDTRPNVIVLGGGSRWVAEGGQLKWIWRERRQKLWSLPALFYRNPINVSSAIVRRKCLVTFPEPFRVDLQRCEDWDLWIRLADRGDILVDGRVVVNHYLTENGMSRKDPELLLEAYAETYQQIFTGLMQDSLVSPILAKSFGRVQFSLRCAQARQKCQLHPKLGRSELVRLAFQHPLWMQWKSAIAAIAFNQETLTRLRGILSRVY